MRFFDLRSPFFVPLWRRIVACVLILGWAMFELMVGNVGWAITFGVAGAWMVWSLLIAWVPPGDES